MIGATLPSEHIDPDLSIETENVATTGTDGVTKQADSVSTEVTQIHDVRDLADRMNQLLLGIRIDEHYV